MYKVRGKDGKPVEVTEQQYRELVGDRTTTPYANKVYSGAMSIEDVPEEHRETVRSIVAAREAFSGPYQLPDKEALRQLREAME